MLKKLFFAGFALVLALIATNAQAAEFIAPDREGNGTVVISKDEAHKNLYLAGGSVTVSSPVGGDLYVGGGTVTIDGDVESDLVVGGGNITVNGKVGGDVRTAGGTVVINNLIGGDLLVGGGTVRISDKATVGGDLVAGSGELHLMGPVAGSVRIGGGDITIASKIGGGVWVRSGDSLVFDRGAEVGNVNYRGVKAAVVREGAVVGKIDFQKLSSSERARHGFAVIMTLAFVFKVLAFIAAGLVLIWLFPKKVSAATHSIVARPGLSLLIGFLTLIATPFLAILLFIVGIGYMLAFILLALFVLMLLFSAVIATIFVGSWLEQKLTKKPDLKVDWQAVVIGVIVLAILGLIPVIGWIICGLAFLMALGGLGRMIYNERLM